MNFPKPNQTLWQLLGPSIVFVALSLNGGEMLLWPDLVGKYGLFILIAVPLILAFQFFVNIEIERYVITTGRNTVSDLVNNYKIFKYVFPILIVVSLMWPAWISNAGNLLSYTLGIRQYGAIVSIFMLGLLLLIWFSKKSYNILENIAKVGLVTVFFIGIYIVINGLFNNSISFENSSFLPQSKDAILYVSALAFGGVSGVLNLVQAHWVEAKGYGVSKKEESELAQIDYNSGESKNNWKSWYKLLIKEHTILFFFGNVFGIFLISLVGYFTIYQKNLSGFNILTFQVDYLGKTGLGLIWAIGIIMLFSMAQMTILDAAGRLLSHTFTKFKPSQLSQLFGLIGIGILTITALFPTFNQPSMLLQISATTSAFIMGIYPPILLHLNNHRLPDYAKPKLINKIGVYLCSAFYLIMTIWALFNL
jgi:hypothetical protein